MKEITFTGRDVPIREISVATGKSTEFIKRGLRSGLIDFGYALKSDRGSRYSGRCQN